MFLKKASDLEQVCSSAPDGCVTGDKTTSEPEVAHLPTLRLSGVWGQIKGDNILLKETICKLFLPPSPPLPPTSLGFYQLSGYM